MITTQVPLSRFVVLFPHHDFLRPIRVYRSHLFASGHIGAFSFPPCIPLGYANEALKREQLSSLALHLRLQAESISGYFHLSSPGKSRKLGKQGFPYIPMRLSPTIQPLPTGIPLESFAEPDFILCLTDRVDPALGELAFPLRFRAAFVANLVVWPASCGEAGLSFCWERGTPVWLPAPTRRKLPK